MSIIKSHFSLLTASKGVEGSGEKKWFFIEWNSFWMFRKKEGGGEIGIESKKLMKKCSRNGHSEIKNLKEGFHSCVKKFLNLFNLFEHDTQLKKPFNTFFFKISTSLVTCPTFDMFFNFKGNVKFITLPRRKLSC